MASFPGSNASRDRPFEAHLPPISSGIQPFSCIGAKCYPCSYFSCKFCTTEHRYSRSSFGTRSQRDPYDSDRPDQSSMPPGEDVFSSAHLSLSSVMSSAALTPPPDDTAHERHVHSEAESYDHDVSAMNYEDNTAAGMALSQEDSMYITPASSPIPDTHEIGTQGRSADDAEDGVKNIWQTRESDNTTHCPSSPGTGHYVPTEGMRSSTVPDVEVLEKHDRMEIEPESRETAATKLQEVAPKSPSSRRTTPSDEELPPGLAKVDLTLKRTGRGVPWDFTDKKPTMKSPSSLFQPCSKFVGTQQSDSKTYNVEVTILTMDMAQSSMSGYLLIRGLTPEHPMLQTFFTGQIVGGPNQRYSFKTMDPSWGANDKVDLQHWLRFPPWRPLTAHAKRDMAFDFPLDGEPWWTQDHVFMRWKEHFLVPDHRQSNIQGASFEGFYYICLNLKEGKISGVYFHSKSEKYQQLELTHVTKRGLGVFGTSPLIELR